MAASPDPSLFFSDRHDPDLASFHELLDQIRARPQDDFLMCVSPDIVADGETTMMLQLVAALQHHPDLIDQLLFSIHFQFEIDEITGTCFTGDSWKDEDDIQYWFAQMAKRTPWSVFFLHDNDARTYAFLADIREASGEEIELQPGRGAHASMVLTPKQADILCNRVLQACELMLHFCRPTGIDPQPAVEALMAEFNVFEMSGWDYEQLLVHFQQEVDKGFQMRITSADEDGDDDLPADDE